MIKRRQRRVILEENDDDDDRHATIPGHTNGATITYRHYYTLIYVCFYFFVFSRAKSAKNSRFKIEPMYK